MAEEANHRNRLVFTITGMSHFVTRIYKKHKTGYNPIEITEEDFYLPEKLKSLLVRYVNYFKHESYITAHNHYADMEDREGLLSRSFRCGLKELGDRHPHKDFLRECTLYIMSGVELEELDFPEAPDIVIDAIHEACITTRQHEALRLWRKRQ